MATSETYKDRSSGERITQTEWHNIVIWRGMAETAEKYLRKGSQVFIEGKIKTRSWEDQQGQKRYTTEVVADVMQLLDRPGANQGANAGSGSVSAQTTDAAKIAADNSAPPTAPTEATQKALESDATNADDLPF
jgi:single-strand DNA-binding protein